MLVAPSEGVVAVKAGRYAVVMHCWRCWYCDCHCHCPLSNVLPTASVTRRTLPATIFTYAPHARILPLMRFADLVVESCGRPAADSGSRWRAVPLRNSFNGQSLEHNCTLRTVAALDRVVFR